MKQKAKTNNNSYVKLTSFFLFFIPIVFFFSCEKETNSITVEDLSSLEQSVFADQTEGNKKIVFSTTKEWISETSADWLSLSPNMGNTSGKHSVSLVFEKNYSGTDRSAEIQIICDNETISIKATQKATIQDGSILKSLEQLLIGHWAEEPRDERFFAVFNDDGTAIWWAVVNGEKQPEVHYTYEFDTENRILHLTDLNESEEKSSGRVLELTQTVLKVQSLEDEEDPIIYYRIEE